MNKTKVKIKTWDELLKISGIDDDGDIRCGGSGASFTRTMGSCLPDNRVIEVNNIDGDWLWYVNVPTMGDTEFIISQYMIETVYNVEDIDDEDIDDEDIEISSTKLLDIKTKVIIANISVSSTSTVKKILEENGEIVVHIFSVNFVKRLNENENLLTVKYC